MRGRGARARASVSLLRRERSEVAASALGPRPLAVGCGCVPGCVPWMALGSLEARYLRYIDRGSALCHVETHV